MRFARSPHFLLMLMCVLTTMVVHNLPTALAQYTAFLGAAYSTSGQTSTFHAGQGSLIEVSVRFSQPVAAFAADTPSVEVDGGSVQSVSSSTFQLPVAGNVKVYTFVLVASGNGPVTFRLNTGQSCNVGGICGSDGNTLRTVPVPRAIPGPVTANFESGSYTAAHSIPAEVVVSLDAEPLRRIAIPFSTAYSGEVTSQQVSGIPASLTFSPGETRKTFTVAPDDGISGTIDIAFGSLPAGINAGGVTVASVAVHNSQVWEAFLTVGAVEGFLGYGALAEETEGILSTNEFTWRGTEYAVNNLLISPTDDQEFADVELEVAPGFEEETDGLSLIIGDLCLNLADGKVNGRQYYWEGVELDLDEDETVDVALREFHPLLSIRSRDGRYNNAVHSTWGQTETELLRGATVSYTDRVSSPPTWLPSARLISNEAMDQSRSIANSAQASSMLWQWGQFLDHDIGHTPPGPSGESVPIAVPTGDPVFDGGQTGRTTLAFTRSQFYPGTGTGPDNPREQINNLTAFIDASQIYGSDWTRAHALRVNDGSGKLMTSGDGDFLPYNRNGLDNDGGASRRDLFLSGDVRANEQTGLTALHTLFLREHNRLAEEVAEQYPELNGDEIYEISRKIVGAQMQVITYNEFLPKLLGPGAIDPYDGYDPNVDPSIANEFSTAAFRVGHTMLPSRLLRVDNRGRQAQVSLANAFFRPSLVERYGISPFLRGLVRLPAEEIDLLVVDEVRNLLFRGAGVRGTDLAALNIQRTRDHGIASYNLVRQAYGLEPVASFSDISSDPSVQRTFEEIYDEVGHLELWSVGLAEDHVEGAMIGETFHTIIVDQFTRLRDGDRFWFENDPYFLANHGSLDELRGTTLADIIRRNTPIDDEIPGDVFTLPPPVR